MKAERRVRKWGNSLAIRIPQRIAEELGLSDESDVEINTNGRAMIVKPGAQAKKWSLEDLLDGATPEIVQGEFEWGPDVGVERWYGI